ncbi:MAG: nucleotidyltransferase [Peptococcia bacterium]
MTVTGIIAEYNPFHNGHLFHLQETKRLLPESPVIAVMSGHFLQRGEPALLNKWARAEMAILQGVDLVLELPVLYSCRSAYWFARGGLEILKATGVVSHFSFGVENDDLSALTQAASILAQEESSFKQDLQEYLNQGLSFPKARAEALQKNTQLPQNLWSKPNNVLALTYLQVNEELQLDLIAVPIKRRGSGYNEKSLRANENPSASAIRAILTNSPDRDFSETLHNLEPYLPSTSIEIIEREYKSGQCPVHFESLTPQILTLLRRSSPEELQHIIEVTEGLENRLYESAFMATNLADYLSLVKTKRFTYSRLQRFLIHLLLNYRKTNETLLHKGPPYLRVLGFNATGQKVLKEIKSRSKLPVITQGKESKKLISSSRFRVFWEKDILASDLYNLLYPAQEARKGKTDYLLSPFKDT